MESVTSLDADLSRTCGGALHVIQSVADLQWSPGPRLWLVTRGAQALDGALTDRVAISQAPLWGVGRVLGLEHPNRLVA